MSTWENPCETSEQMATSLVDFVRQSESIIGKDERVWLSTENLDSLFGVFKQLEGKHSKGGFTSLLAAMPMMLVDWTPGLVRERLSEVFSQADERVGG